MDNIPYSEFLENWNTQVLPVIAATSVLDGYAKVQQNYQRARISAEQTLKAFESYKERVKKHFEKEALDE